MEAGARLDDSSAVRGGGGGACGGGGGGGSVRCELCRSLFFEADEAEEGGEGTGPTEGGGGVAPGCHGSRCNFAHSLEELVASRGRRHPTAAHVADQFALWLVESHRAGGDETSRDHPENGLRSARETPREPPRGIDTREG